MRHALIGAIAILAGCSQTLPTAPTNARLTLTISQSNLLVGGTAVVTATIRQSNGSPVDGAHVLFSGGLGSFSPHEVFTVAGVATTTFTATANGIGMIGALSGSVAAEPLQVRIGEWPTLPPINTTPQTPTIFLSCNSGTAGVPTICAMSGSHLQTIAVRWGDGSPEESVSPTTTSVAHVFPRADHYTVIARGEDRVGQVVHASATATIVNPPPPPPVLIPPSFATSVAMTQEANATAGCASFYISAAPATGATIVSVVVTKTGGGTVATLSVSGRFATCGLIANTDILTATVTDSNGGTASYPLVVR